jgi:hypothetical protein
MSRCTLRYLFTILLYGGVAIMLVPYISGNTSRALIFLVAGIGVALVAGFLRCYFTEGDCTERMPTDAVGSSAPNRLSR